MGSVGVPSVPYLLETTADVRRRIDVLQRNLEHGCASSELEALQRLLWYREGYVGNARRWCTALSPSSLCFAITMTSSNTDSMSCIDL